MRPWQHVLDALEGYLQLGPLLAGKELKHAAFNFAPENGEDELNVGQLASRFLEKLGRGKFRIEADPKGPWEAPRAALGRLAGPHGIGMEAPFWRKRRGGCQRLVVPPVAGREKRQGFGPGPGQGIAFEREEAMSDALRQSILESVRAWAEAAHAKKPFEPGRDPVPVSGRVFSPEDVATLVDSGMDFWLTTGRFNDQFEKMLGDYQGGKALTVNSGSSANLLALASLTSPSLGERALKAGDEIITVAAGFPTTVNPSLIYGLTPVFVDVDAETSNAIPALVEAAITPKTRAIMMAHTLGNPL